MLEILINPNEIYTAPERRIKSGQHDLTKIHRQWFTQELEKREKLLKHQPVIIQRIQNDFNKLEDLANERVSLAEEALKLVSNENDHQFPSSSNLFSLSLFFFLQG